MSVSSYIFDTLPRDCWLNIDCAQLVNNVRLLAKVVQRPLLVAVKGNGYGHGYDHASKAFVDAGVSYLAVANYAEAHIVRQAVASVPILILGAMLATEMALSAASGFEFFVFRPEHVALLRDLPKTTSPIRIHIKVDTGMGRLGCFPEEVGNIAEALREIPGVVIAGLATHFAKASQPNNEHTNRQIARFEQAIATLSSIGIRPEIIHASNSSGALYHPQARYDMVRFGLSAYGIRSTSVEGCDLPNGVRSAMTWHARITASKILPAESTVSYGGEYVLSHNARVGILPVGYVDGYRRIPKDVNTALVNGQERKILGRINMDQCMLDLDGLSDITGAEVVLLGKQGNREISVYDLSRRWETNTYSVCSNISPRVPRRVVGS